MTRADLIQSLAQRFPQLSAMDVEISAKEILSAIGIALVRGNRVEVRGFGSFGVSYRPPALSTQSEDRHPGRRTGQMGSLLQAKEGTT